LGKPVYYFRADGIALVVKFEDSDQSRGEIEDIEGVFLVDNKVQTIAIRLGVDVTHFK